MFQILPSPMKSDGGFELLLTVLRPCNTVIETLYFFPGHLVHAEATSGTNSKLLPKSSKEREGHLF